MEKEDYEALLSKVDTQAKTIADLETRLKDVCEYNKALLNRAQPSVDKEEAQEKVEQQNAMKEVKEYYGIK